MYTRQWKWVFFFFGFYYMSLFNLHFMNFSVKHKRKCYIELFSKDESHFYSCELHSKAQILLPPTCPHSELLHACYQIKL